MKNRNIVLNFDDKPEEEENPASSDVPEYSGSMTPSGNKENASAFSSEINDFNIGQEQSEPLFEKIAFKSGSKTKMA